MRVARREQIEGAGAGLPISMSATNFALLLLRW